MPSPITTGFYRYTDIYFEWHKALDNPVEQSALKAFISHDALVHPDHPLRTSPHGIELFMGTLPSGQARLMFSSKQVEYLRYWIYEMGFVDRLIPIPTSDYLLTKSILRNSSSVFYNNAAELKKAIKMIDKNNKRLKGVDSDLLSFRQAFEKIRTLWASQKGTWMAVDFEAWEMEHRVLTEFGWSSIRWENGEEIISEGHIINQSNYNYRNTKYVPDNKDSYKFGVSERLDRKSFTERIRELVAEACQKQPLYLVFHDSSQDLRYLEMINAPITGYTYILPETPDETGIYVTDTSQMFAALEGETGERRKFGTLCNLLKIKTEYLHNGGNDAHYTLLAMRAMATGNQLDIQREERWPGLTPKSAPGMTTTGAGVRVEFDEFDGVEDYDDDEVAMYAPNSSKVVGQAQVPEDTAAPAENLWS